MLGRNYLHKSSLALTCMDDPMPVLYRFKYSQQFLKWALQPPGWQEDWVLGVRVSASGKLVAFITGVPAKMRACEATVSMVEINFLCVHKKLRQKRLAPVLIKVPLLPRSFSHLVRACTKAKCCSDWHVIIIVMSLQRARLMGLQHCHLTCEPPLAKIQQQLMWPTDNLKKGNIRGL